MPTTLLLAPPGFGNLTTAQQSSSMISITRWVPIISQRFQSKLVFSRGFHEKIKAQHGRFESTFKD